MYLLDILLFSSQSSKNGLFILHETVKTKMHREELETNLLFFFLYHFFSVLEAMSLALAFGKSGTLISTLNQFWNEG